MNVRLFATPENAAHRFAEWKRGTVERLYRWTTEWVRARIRTPDGKQFCEITRHTEGWILRGPTKPHPLYRAAELPPDRRLFVCEGEKACDAGWSVGLPCVTSGAANSAKYADWSCLRGREVVILPDHDAAGARYANEVTRALQRLDPPATVHVIELPGLGNGEDLHELVHEHRDSRSADEIRDEILALAASVPARPHTSLTENDDLSDWPDPQPLPDELPPVASFDYDVLPASFRPWIQDIAERMQCPPDFSAIAAMIATSAVVGRKVGIRPKRYDDWLVVPNLWGAGIGPPSLMKTPAIQEPLRPLKRLEIEAKKQFQQDLLDFEAAQLVAEQRKLVAKEGIKKAIKESSRDPLALARKALQGPAPAPARRRYLVNDSTVEKLGEILNENPSGVLAYRDELIGLLKSLDKEGQEGARAFYLEAWNGTGRYTYDRIGRGTIDIEAAIVSVIGSIQPGPLRAYLRGAVSGGDDADGLMQRFQLSVYPDVPKKWVNVDRWPDTSAKRTAFETFQRLDRMDALAVRAQCADDDDDGIPFVRFDHEAQLEFDAWHTELENRLRSGEDHAVIVEHLGKYRSLIPSLALLIHLAEAGSGPVPGDALRRAVGWAAYLESHARRIYATAIKPDTTEAIALSKKIISGELAGEFALRDVYRNGWIGLGTREAAARAVDVLEDLDWLIKSVEETPGRSRTRYRINPKIRQISAGRTDKTDKSAPTTPSVTFVTSIEGDFQDFGEDHRHTDFGDPT